MAYDAANGTTVLFGGQSGGQILDDTWVFDGTTWAPQAPSVSPPALSSASMGFDGHRLILFGGQAGDGSATNTTWAWDGTTWTQLTPAVSPPARFDASVASNGAKDTVVVFGGLASPGTPLGDTWVWDGTTWTSPTTAAAPSIRSGAAMTFDATRGDVVLFGGTTSGGDTADTWTFDGTTWTQATPAKSPPARHDGAFAFDPGSDDGVLFGGVAANGHSILGDTWLWDGSTWTTSIPIQVVPSYSPPARSGASLAGAPAAQRLILFGGLSAGTTPTALSDTWDVTTLLPTEPTTSTTQRPTTTTTGPTSSTSTPGSTPAPTTTPRPKPTPTKPAIRAPLSVASSNVRPGQDVRVSGSGFVPGSTVTITLHSAPTTLGHAVADEHGEFSVVVVVPSDATVGAHHLEATGNAMTGGQALLEAQLSITNPGHSSQWLLAAFMLGLTALLAVAAGLVLVASTRWRPRSSS